MRHHREQDHDAGARPGFERHADRQAVEETVKRETERADQADVVMMSRRVVLLFAMDDRQLLQKENRHETDDDRHHQCTHGDSLMECRGRDFRDEVEEGHADDQPRGEGHDVEEIAAVSERERPAGKSHQERRESVDCGHGGSLIVPSAEC